MVIYIILWIRVILYDMSTISYLFYTSHDPYQFLSISYHIVGYVLCIVKYWYSYSDEINNWSFISLRFIDQLNIITKRVVNKLLLIRLEAPRQLQIDLLGNLVEFTISIVTKFFGHEFGRILFIYELRMRPYLQVDWWL